MSPAHLAHPIPSANLDAPPPPAARSAALRFFSESGGDPSLPFLSLRSPPPPRACLPCVGRSAPSYVVSASLRHAQSWPASLLGGVAADHSTLSPFHDDSVSPRASSSRSHRPVSPYDALPSSSPASPSRMAALRDSSMVLMRFVPM
nr:unnamed protein product [Digitaria exilis]